MEMASLMKVIRMSHNVEWYEVLSCYNSHLTLIWYVVKHTQPQTNLIYFYTNTYTI